MQELQKSFQRHVAYKVRISDILKSNFIKDEQLSAGYIKINDRIVSRVNVIASLVYKFEQPNYASVVIDDGTGKISLRSFDDTNLFLKLDVGDVVLVIGRVREFNGEKYIIPEIFKRVGNIEWIHVRNLELFRGFEKSAVSANNKILAGEVSNIEDDVYTLIKELDNGDGVAIDDLIKSLKNDDVEKSVNRLLEKGDVFEIRPGKLRVLE